MPTVLQSQKDPRCRVSPLPAGCPLAHVHATLLAAQEEERQTASFQDGRAPAFSLRQELVMGDARHAHLGELPSSLLEAKGVCDEWFVDDGQVFVRPWPFFPWLRALDAALASIGATWRRHCQELCPSPLSLRAHVRVCGEGTSCVHDTVAVLCLDLGTGSRHINARAWELVRACDEMCSAIVGVDHAPTELVLPRQCADVSKLMYHMRINRLACSFDGQLRASVSAALCGASPDHSWWQATSGGHLRCLCLRTALGAARPAFVASRNMCRPLVSTIVDLQRRLRHLKPADHGRVRHAHG